MTETKIRWKCVKCKKEMDDIEWEEHQGCTGRNEKERNMIRVKCDCSPKKFLRFRNIQEELSRE